MMTSDPRGWCAYVPSSFARVSPLYASLYQNLEQDAPIRELLTLIDPDQPIPVVFFSVISFLVLGNPQHAFARFYPYLQQPPHPVNEAYPVFRAFCLEHLDELHTLLPWARLQTNEVTRCANLLLAFEIVSRREKHRPLALIEIGCSAGLNLRWDDYHYTYGSTTMGDATSPVKIQCTLQGALRPSLPQTMPLIAQRIGLDLAPLDVADEEDVRWLRACIWPEEVERYRLLDAALAMARKNPLPILAGDALVLLSDVLARIPQEQALCLWHSFALRQGPALVREGIERQIAEASRTRTIYRISIEVEPSAGGLPRLELFTYQAGNLCHSEWLANCEFHGQAMEWLASWV